MGNGNLEQAAFGFKVLKVNNNYIGKSLHTHTDTTESSGNYLKMFGSIYCYC